jgi:arylsulfatase A-like enzyme
MTVRDLGYSLCVLASLACSPSPDVVLITFDALRADHTSLYGYERNTTPNLKAFFADGTTFENVTSSAPCTVPSVRQMLAGRFDHQGPRLAEVYAEHGYDTAAIVSQHAFRWTPGLRDYTPGFAHFDIQPQTQQDRYGMTRRNAREVTDRALRWLLDRQPGRHFFLWLHYFEPHDPHSIPDEFKRWQVSESRIKDGDRRRYLHDFGREQGVPWPSAGAGFSREEVEHFISLYDDELLYADHHVHRFLRELQNRFPDSLVVFSSDHGDHLGEGDRWDHCTTLYEPEIRVPLAINVPPDTFPRASIAGAVSTLDIFPTLLGLSGISVDDLQRDGHDLQSSRIDRFAISMFRNDVTIRDAHYKLRMQRGDTGQPYARFALYDLENDPQESTNVMDAYPERVETLEIALRDRMPDMLMLAAENDATLETLKSLGYTE